MKPTEGHSRRAVTADGAPAAIGPYSHAVQAGGMLYCSGALPIGPDGELVTRSVAAETKACLDNLALVSRAAGARLQDAVKLTVYTTTLDEFPDINEAYGAYFDEQPPARVTVGVAQLPKGARVEIDAVVALA